MRVTWAEVRITNETRKASENCAMIIRRNIAFKLRAYGKDGNIFQIRLRTTFNGQRFDIKTGCQIHDKDFWDDGAGLVKDGY